MHRVANFYNRIFTWSNLYQIFASSLTRKVYIWLFITPILVRFLALFEKNLSLEIALPASFLLLYFAALLLAVSAVLWFLNAPKIIVEFPELALARRTAVPYQQLNIYSQDLNVSLESDAVFFDLWWRADQVKADKKTYIVWFQALALMLLLIYFVINLMVVIQF